MSEIRRDEIIYEEGWRESSPAAEPEKTDGAPLDEAAGEPAAEPAASRPLLLTIQLALCLLFALAVFLLKSMDSELYHGFMDYYRDELNKPVISRGVFDSIDLGRLFGESGVAVTPDEAADS